MAPPWPPTLILLSPTGPPRAALPALQGGPLPTTLPALLTMTPWAKKRTHQPQVTRTPRPPPRSSRLPRVLSVRGQRWGPAASRPRAPCGTALCTMAQNQPCPLGGNPILGMGRKIQVLQSHPRDFLYPRGAHLGHYPPNHSPDLPSPGAGRMGTMARLPSPMRLPGLPSLPRSPLVSPQGHRCPREWPPLMAMVTTTRKLEEGRPRPPPRRFGPGCPQVHPSLDITVCSDTSPLLPTAGTQTGLAAAGNPAYRPPAPCRPLCPPAFTQGRIPTQLLTTGGAWGSVGTARSERQRTKSPSLPPWEMSACLPPGSLPSGVGSTSGEAPSEG